ncbi:hypothetical protein BY996DRAFT_6421855 [Phakopsora pachyrhizi]|nr:hypothetical protein BY996DRAFT_6421855 [Phakopsora pachyrhizi]
MCVGKIDFVPENIWEAAVPVADVTHSCHSHHTCDTVDQISPKQAKKKLQSPSNSPAQRSTGTVYPDDSGKVASSKEFKQREQGEEARYVREKEAAELRKLREELGKQQKKIDELESRLSTLLLYIQRTEAHSIYVALECRLLYQCFIIYKGVETKLFFRVPQNALQDDLALTWIWYLPAG